MTLKYEGCMVALATMHRKERAFAKPFLRHLNASVVVPDAIDTDQYGTFSGEIPRGGTMLDAARKKARLGAQLTGLPYVLASEGSFGPHPVVPFIACDQELILFVDYRANIEIRESLLTYRTNYNETTGACIAELDGFLRSVQFPSHAVIVAANSPANGGYIRKGIDSSAVLEACLGEAASYSVDGRARIMTDMRADKNPTRMRVIRALATRVSRRLSSHCPDCGLPGFGAQTMLPGLPCAECGEPTSAYRAKALHCPHCPKVVEVSLSGRVHADPAHCGNCNP